MVNGFVWQTVVLPQKTELGAWQGAKTLAALKPRLKALLAESRQLRVEQAKSELTQKDPQAAMQAIQKSAGQYGVAIKETRMKGQATPKEAQTAQTAIPLELEVTGSFNKLARWMNDMETEAGFQIDSWSLKPSSTSDRISELSVKLTTFLGES